MLNKIYGKLILSQGKLAAAGLLILTAGLGANFSALAPTTTVAAAAPLPAPQMADGIYIYGQSPQPEEIGKEYLVFESRNNKVVGAIYMPQSEFNCFYGTLEADKLSLNVVDPFDSSVSNYSIGWHNQERVASNQEVGASGLQLSGYYQLRAASNGDRQILNACQENYKKLAGQ